MCMSYSWVSFWWKVTWQRNAEWRHSVRRPCDTMRIRRRAYRNTIMLNRSSVLYGTMYRVASICFCIFQRCTSHRTMYMTYCTTYPWIRHDSVKAEYDTWFFSSRTLSTFSYPTNLPHITAVFPYIFLSHIIRNIRWTVWPTRLLLMQCGAATYYDNHSVSNVFLGRPLLIKHQCNYLLRIHKQQNMQVHIKNI